MLVRRYDDQLATRSHHLARDELVCIERLGGAEVVDLAACASRAAQLDRDSVGGAGAGTACAVHRADGNAKRLPTVAVTTTLESREHRRSRWGR